MVIACSLPVVIRRFGESPVVIIIVVQLLRRSSSVRRSVLPSVRSCAERTCGGDTRGEISTGRQMGHGSQVTIAVLHSRSAILNVAPRAVLHIHQLRPRSMTVALSAKDAPTSRSSTCPPNFSASSRSGTPHSVLSDAVFPFRGNTCGTTQASERRRRRGLHSYEDGGQHAGISGTDAHVLSPPYMARWWMETLEHNHMNVSTVLLLRACVMCKWKWVGVEPSVPVSKYGSGEDRCPLWGS